MQDIKCILTPGDWSLFHRLGPPGNTWRSTNCALLWEERAVAAVIFAPLRSAQRSSCPKNLGDGKSEKNEADWSWFQGKCMAMYGNVIWNHGFCHRSLGPSTDFLSLHPILGSSCPRPGPVFLNHSGNHGEPWGNPYDSSTSAARRLCDMLTIEMG